MTRVGLYFRMAHVAAILLLTASAWPSLLAAQGITSAALQGRVAGSDGRFLEGATVSARSVASGLAWQVVTDAAGRFFLENVETGGPYVLEARRIGYAPARRGDVWLALGQRHRADFVLTPIATALRDVIVLATANAVIHSGRTGPEQIISGTQLSRLPNLTRDLGTLAALAPLAVLRPVGGISIAGQNQGFNSLQVDGGVNADLYLGRAPGGASPSGALPEVLPHALSIETVREFQVLAAPFDVRLGNFAGGLLNAVTKSGTNDFQGALFAYLQHGTLTGRNTAGRVVDFATWQFGGTLSGPIVPDRAHYFVNVDVQERVVPDPGPFATDRGLTGATEASALRFRNVLADSFSIQAGDFTSAGHLPARDIFAKVTIQLGATGRLELSQRHAHGERRGFMDVGRTFDSTAFSSVAGLSRSTAQTSRLIWSAVLRDRMQSELILSYQRIRDSCAPNADFPLIQVKAESGNLIAGPNSVCPTTDVAQNVVEMTGNLTIGAGTHLFTIGSHAEVMHFRDPLVQVSAGRWDFQSVDSLANRLPSHYDRGIPSADRPGGVEFGVIGIGAYAQDRWALTERLAITAGLRADVPLLSDAPATSAVMAERGIDTGRLPSGEVQWSPRVGVNYDWRGDATAFLRGGIGLFAGPPPYRWLGNAYRDTGDEMLVNCDAAVPQFTPRQQPGTCVGGGGVSPRISYFERGFRYPQNLKVSVGADRRLSNGLIASLDVLYTRAVHQVYITSANLGAPRDTRAFGEGNRPLYGTFSSTTGRATPGWLDRSSNVGELYRLSNGSGDNALSLSVQARKEFTGRLGIQGAYAYSRVRDRMSIVNFPARANFSNTPVDGTLEDRRLRSSFFETPHKVALAATVGPFRRTQLTLLYVAASQPPFTYVVNGDANADGIGGPGSLRNDIMYVPRDSSDITLFVRSSAVEDWSRLDAFIEQRDCLREQRGRIMARGSCRNGWLSMLNARATTLLPVARGRSDLEIMIDIINLPNLFNSRWGLQRGMTTGPSVSLLGLAGWDEAKGRGKYRVPKLPNAGLVDDASSRWRVQLGARYFIR